MKPQNIPIHFFDLDGTLIEIDAKAWIIDKETPHKPIIRLDKYEMSKILNGLYVRDNLKIEYNDEEYFISNILFNKINRYKTYDINQLGLSWIEFKTKKYIDKYPVRHLLNNIKHLANKENRICILTGRSNRERNADLVNELRLKLQNIGVELFKMYFVSDKFNAKHNDQISIRKCYILLEHMTGVKIKDNKFVELKQDWYDDIYFYDDEHMNIDYANNIQNTFNAILKNTEDEIFKLIVERLNNNIIKLTTNLITNNELNPFVVNQIILKSPVKYPIKLESFQNFQK